MMNDLTIFDLKDN